MQQRVKVKSPSGFKPEELFVGAHLGEREEALLKDLVCKL